MKEWQGDTGKRGNFIWFGQEERARRVKMVFRDQESGEAGRVQRAEGLKRWKRLRPERNK